MNPYASTDPRLNALRPVLELLVTLRQLEGLVQTLNLTPAQVTALRAALAGVGRAAVPTHTAQAVSAADVLNSQLLALLGDNQRRQLSASRDAQTARLRALLSRARLASQDGRPQTARLAYNQWLGTEVVDALLAQPDSAAITRRVRAAALQLDQALGNTAPER